MVIFVLGSLLDFHLKGRHLGISGVAPCWSGEIMQVKSLLHWLHFSELEVACCMFSYSFAVVKHGPFTSLL